jgi:F0F1-type ATP synthase assembly protein I
MPEESQAEDGLEKEFEELDRLIADARRVNKEARKLKLPEPPQPRLPVESKGMEAVTLGIQFAATIGACAGGGYLVDKYLNSSPVAVILGFSIGVAGAFRLLVRFAGRSGQD